MLVKLVKTYKNKNKRKRVPSVGVIPRDDEILADYLNHKNGLSPRRIDYSSDSDCDSEDSYERRVADEPPTRHQSNRVPLRDLVTFMPIETVSKENTSRIISLQPVPYPQRLISDRTALNSSTRDQLVQCLATVNVVKPAPPTNYSVVVQRQSNISSGVPRRSSKERMVHNVASRRQDHETSSLILVDTVAWMIILGDALLNFIDGLSIGAAFDRNILAGMSISVAVMLEEVTHRLGTFAVLIRAGMSMKQGFLYIFLSGCACYPGLAMGIFLGDAAEDASPYIFALAG